MAFTDLFKRGADRPDYLAGPLGPRDPNAYQLTQIAVSDLFDLDAIQFPLDRTAAIQIPAVSAVRNLLVATIGNLPLVALDATNTPLADQPAWLYRSDSLVSPYERASWIVDDLLFYGFSLLARKNGADGFPVDVQRVPMQDWKITNGHIQVNDQDVQDTDVILINSPYEGLLFVGARKLREARDIETQLAQKVNNPVPITVIRNTSDVQLEQDEISDLLAQWSAARNDTKGALGYLPSGLELEVFGQQDPAMFLEARNAIVTNVGQLTGISASMLQGTAGTDSLTYTTKNGEASRFLGLELPGWLAPITSRLSQDDCVPRGTHVAFDTSELLTTQTPTGAPLED